MRLAIHNDKSGLWDFTNLADPLSACPLLSRKAKFQQPDNKKVKRYFRILQSIVSITTERPVKRDGISGSQKEGIGFVLDAQRGLVLASRNIVPHDLCDLTVVIAGTVMVEAKIRFLHPLAHFAIIQYDPSLVLPPVQSAKLSKSMIKQGTAATFLSVDGDFRLVADTGTVTDIEPLSLPSQGVGPQYRASNIEVIDFDNAISEAGVLTNKQGTIDAFWMDFIIEDEFRDLKRGLAAPSILPLLRLIQSEIQPNPYIFNFEVEPISMMEASLMGVSEAWIDSVIKISPSLHRLFRVKKVNPSYPPDTIAESLKAGDIILTLKNNLVTDLSPFGLQDDRSIEALIVRNKAEKHISVLTAPSQALHTTHNLQFCGMTLQQPHHAVYQETLTVSSEVYISFVENGSPGAFYNIALASFITAVNNQPTPTLSRFIDVVHAVPDNTAFRLRTVSAEGREEVQTLKKQLRYFPTVEFRKYKGGDWVRSVVEEA